MNTLKRAVFACVLVAASIFGLAATSSDASAHGYKHAYKYHTGFGFVKFHNFNGRWPVVKKFKRHGSWYKCKFWPGYYDCDPYYKKGKSAYFFGKGKHGFFFGKKFGKKHKHGSHFKKHY